MDTAGNVKDKYSFDEFGNDKAGGKQSPNASNVLNNYFGYTGEMWDSEAGLQYLRARYYDPEIGRFLTRDSITGVIENPLSQNRYTYAWNNPVNYTDPSGHWPELLKKAVNSAINFGKKVVNSVVEFGRSVVNSVTSFFSGSSRSQSSASQGSRRTSIRRSGRREEDTVPNANSAVKRTRPAGSYQSTMKCHANLGVDPIMTLDDLQLALDVAGYFLEPFDLLNAAIYLARGDKANAALSAAAVVPLVGVASTGPRLVRKVGHAVATKDNYRKLFLDKFPNLPKGHQVHHILPQKYETIMKNAGINIHEVEYLKGIDAETHKLITKEWMKWDKALGKTPTAQDVIDFAKQIDNKYNKYWFNK